MGGLIIAIVIAFLLLLIATFLRGQGFDPENIDELRKIAESKVAVKPPMPFTTDACSIWPNKIFGKDATNICIDHDMEYWKGGTSKERKQADQKMRDRMNAMIFPLGTIMYLGVRIFGHPRIPAPWRWGYGFHYPYPHKY